MSKNNENEMSLAEYLARQSSAAYPETSKQFLMGTRALGKLEQPSEISSADFVKQNKKRRDDEHLMQCQMIIDFDRDYPEYEGLLIGIPNGAKLPYRKTKSGKRYSPEAIRLLAEGMRPGVCDLLLPIPRGDWHGLFIENKILPNKPEPEQLRFMARMNQLKYYCVVNYTLETGNLYIRNYLNLPPYGTESES